MDKIKFLNDLCQKLSDVLPQNVHTLKDDVEKNFQTVLKNAFNKLDLVTREEFDAQTKVLARSRQKIEALETKIAELEKMIDKKQGEQK